MSANLQATCPGCKSVLRIPADWVNQPIRCKHCGLVMVSKDPQAVAAAVAGRPAPPNKTPLPPTGKPTPVAAPVAKSAPASSKKAGATDPGAKAVLPAHSVPTATAAGPGRANGSVFAGLHVADPNPATGGSAKPQRRTVKKRSTWWKGPVIAISVFFLAVLILAFNWPKLSKLLPS